jgi:hypothetical protein
LVFVQRARQFLDSILTGMLGGGGSGCPELVSLGEEFFAPRMGKSQRCKKSIEMRLALSISTNEVVRTEFAQKGKARGYYPYRNVLNYSALFLIRV